jgi:hypothetical protein
LTTYILIKKNNDQAVNSLNNRMIINTINIAKSFTALMNDREKYKLYIKENNINSYVLNKRGEEYYGIKDSDNIFNVFTKDDNILVGGIDWDICLHKRVLGFLNLKKRNFNIYSSPDICIRDGKFITTNHFNSDEKIEWDTLDNNTFKVKKLK